MSKPSRTADWATDTLYPAGSNVWNEQPTKVTTSAGHMAVGHEPGERTPAQEMNDWQNVVGQWIAYLDAGVWDGDLEIDGNLLVDDGAEIVGDLTVGGEIFHGDRQISGSFNVNDMIEYAGSATANGNNPGIVLDAGISIVRVPLRGLQSHYRVKSVTIWLPQGPDSGTVEYTLHVFTLALGSEVFNQRSTLDDISGAAVVTLTVETPFTVSPNEELWLLIDATEASGEDFALNTWSITYDVAP